MFIEMLEFQVEYAKLLDDAAGKSKSIIRNYLQFSSFKDLNPKHSVFAFYDIDCYYVC